MVRITHVHMVGGIDYEHIDSMKWVDPGTGATGDSTSQELVDYIKQGGQAVVSDGIRQVQVGVVKASPPYVRTHADGVWTDNLLALPRY
jgi:hypothetical protein